VSSDSAFVQIGREKRSGIILRGKMMKIHSLVGLPSYLMVM